MGHTHTQKKKEDKVEKEVKNLVIDSEREREKAQKKQTAAAEWTAAGAEKVSSGAFDSFFFL